MKPTVTSQHAKTNLPELDHIQADWDILMEIHHDLLSLLHAMQFHSCIYTFRLKQHNLDDNYLFDLDFYEQYGCARPEVLMTPRMKVHIMVITIEVTFTSTDYAVNIQHTAGQGPIAM